MTITWKKAELDGSKNCRSLNKGKPFCVVCRAFNKISGIYCARPPRLQPAALTQSPWHKNRIRRHLCVTDSQCRVIALFRARTGMSMVCVQWVITIQRLLPYWLWLSMREAEANMHQLVCSVEVPPLPPAPKKNRLQGQFSLLAV